MAKPVVFVIGASGLVGSSTLKVLSEKYSDTVEIRAGVRNPNKAENLKSLLNVAVTRAEMGDAALKDTLRGVDTLYIVTPGTEHRVPITIATAEAAKEAGVKHILVISVTISDTFFGRQYSKLNSAVKTLGVPYTFLNLPFFVDNNLWFKDSIKEQGAIYYPVDGTKPFISAVVSDIAKASAVILVNPEKHVNETYEIISDYHTYEDIAAAFSEALGKKVTYNRTLYDETKQVLLALGLPEWQITAILELCKLIDNGAPEIIPTDRSDFHKLTGEEPTSLKTWISQVKGAFQ